MFHKPYLNGRMKPLALATAYACYVIGYDWRVANGLEGDA